MYPVFSVLSKGTATSFQDFGRRSYRHLGIPCSGAIDLRLYKRCIRLLGIPQGSSVLEINGQGPSLRIEHPCYFLLSRNLAKARLDNQFIPTEKAHFGAPGQTLKLGPVTEGNYAYFCLDQQFNLSNDFLSTSTFTISGLGGYHGRTLEKLDMIYSNTCLSRQSNETFLEQEDLYLSSSNELSKISVHRGPEFSFWEKMWGTSPLPEYQIHPDSNRMAIIGVPQTKQKTIESFSMKSSGIFPGVIQMNYEGELMIIMADGQTTGGYPRVGIIEEHQLWQIAQYKPGARFRLSFS
jgi:allophanate hydrolase subunit 2